MSVHNLQNVLRDLTRVTIRVMVGLGQKFANCACVISKLCSAFCKLCRLANHVQQKYFDQVWGLGLGSKFSCQRVDNS